MHNLTETSFFTAAVPVPDDAVDLRTAASLLGAFQALTNRTRQLYEALGSLGATDLTFPSANVDFLHAVQMEETLLVLGAAQFLHSPLLTQGIAASGTITAPTITCAGVSSAATLSANNITATTNITAGVNMFCAFINSSNGGVVNTAPLFCNAGVIGKHSWPAVTLAATGASTCNVDQAQVFICTPTANKTAQITEGALTVDGDEIEFATYAAGFTLTILDTIAAGGGTILTMKNASGFSRYARYKRIAGVWRLLTDRAVP